MNWIKRMIILALAISLIWILAACEANNTRQDEQTEDTAGQINREAPADSTYAGVVLYLDEIVNTEAPAGAVSGLLQLTVRFENTTNETITLPFVSDDYIITDDAGFNTVPSTTASELVNPEIAAGESVSGVLEYAVTNATGTFSFHVGNYDDILFSASLADD